LVVLVVIADNGSLIDRSDSEVLRHSLSDGAASGEATHAIGFAGEGAGPGDITVTGRITGIAAFGKNPTVTLMDFAEGKVVVGDILLIAGSIAWEASTAPSFFWKLCGSLCRPPWSGLGLFLPQRSLMTDHRSLTSDPGSCARPPSRLPSWKPLGRSSVGAGNRWKALEGPGR